MNKEEILKRAKQQNKENNDNDYITYIERKARTLSSTVVYVFLYFFVFYPYIIGETLEENTLRYFIMKYHLEYFAFALACLWHRPKIYTNGIICEGLKMQLKEWDVLFC